MDKKAKLRKVSGSLMNDFNFRLQVVLVSLTITPYLTASLILQKRSEKIRENPGGLLRAIEKSHD